VRHNREFTKLLVDTANVTRGRIRASQVYRDFIAYCALRLSIPIDPVHREERVKILGNLLESYREPEQAAFVQTLSQLLKVIEKNVSMGSYDDVLSRAFYEVNAHNKALKQEFTPDDIASLMARITGGSIEVLPKEGYFTLTDPTCGSGNLLLAMAETLASKGFNPTEELVVQAVDLDICCAHMAYIHLSLYGIPAVVIRGNTITLEEYDRWYTPAYLRRKWVWRAPMPFGTKRNRSNELLKMLDEPMYAAFRKAEALWRNGS